MDFLRSNWGPSSIFIVVGIVAYSNNLDGPFIYDDITAIVNNPHIRSLWPPNWLIEAWNPTNAIHSRFVVGFTLAINYALSGTNATSYHCVNIAIHISCALTLLAVIRRTLQSNNLNPYISKNSKRLAFIIAIVWLVHPLQTETVNYILQRTESLMALFYLLTIYCFIRGIRKDNSRTGFVASIFFCALGMGSKETMASAPIMVVLYDRIFLSNTWHEVLERWKIHLGLAATWTVLAIIILRNPHGDTISASSGISSWDYLLNQCQVIPRYLWLTIWPSQLNIDYGFPSPTLTLRAVFPAALLLTTLVSVSTFALFKYPKVGYAPMFFLSS